LAQQRQDKGVQKDSVLLLAIAQRLLGMGTPRRMGSRSLGKQNWTTIADFLAVEQIARAVTTDFTENLTGDSLDAGLRLASRCLARTLRFQGRQEEAIRIFDALDLADDDAVAEGSSIDFQMLGSDLLLDLGRTDEAKERLCRALTLEADIGQAHFMLAKFGGSDRPNHLGQLNEILAGPEKAPAVTSALHCARGLLLEHEGDFEQAFDSFLAAGEAKQRNIEKLGAPEAVFKLDELKSVFDADFFADRHGWGRRDTTPIFIVGLPRSGTTLTEQILASHSQIAGAGELPDIAIIHRRLLGDACGDPIATGRFGDVTAEATERAAQLHSRSLTALHAAPIRSGVKHVVDKMPTNFIHLGTIAMLFPNAKIIHCRRELRDIGISCLKNNLAWPYCHPDGFTPLANDYVKLMQHWHETLPLKIFDLDYESMVDDLDSTVHRLLEFCGVPFEESCLEFHNNTRPVRTPTRGQVRSPIYKTSVAAWRRYEAQLQAKGFDAFCELEH
jgi:tetratricopeptide (TPR) repeat protein